jgi:hypothetical protein
MVRDGERLAVATVITTEEAVSLVIGYDSFGLRIKIERTSQRQERFAEWTSAEERWPSSMRASRSPFLGLRTHRMKVADLFSLRVALGVGSCPSPSQVRYDSYPVLVPLILVSSSVGGAAELAKRGRFGVVNAMLDGGFHCGSASFVIGYKALGAFSPEWLFYRLGRNLGANASVYRERGRRRQFYRENL